MGKQQAAPCVARSRDIVVSDFAAGELTRRLKPASKCATCFGSRNLLVPAMGTDAAPFFEVRWSPHAKRWSICTTRACGQERRKDTTCGRWTGFGQETNQKHGRVRDGYPAWIIRKSVVACAAGVPSMAPAHDAQGSCRCQRRRATRVFRNPRRASVSTVRQSCDRDHYARRRCELEYGLDRPRSPAASPSPTPRAAGITRAYKLTL